MLILYNAQFLFSFYLWSISHPGKTGIPMHDLSNDEQCSVIIPTTLNPLQLRYEQVIMKVFSIPLEITDTIRQTFKSKLRRMGMQLIKLGSKNRLIRLNKSGP